MPSPTGSAKLLIAHVREWRLSQTTLIVMLYLLLNLTGRFSVAIFGLTYNLVDDLVDEYPTYTINWNSSVLLAGGAADVGSGLCKDSTLARILPCHRNFG